MLNEDISKLISEDETQNCDLIDDDAVENIEAKSQKIFPILFDPQTSGGLLFGVPPENADSCLEELQKCGFGEAACIGTVTTMQSESESRPVTIK